MIWEKRNIFEEEIAALKMVRGGPSIAHLYDVYEEDEQAYLVLEFMSSPRSGGPSLNPTVPPRRDTQNPPETNQYLNEIGPRPRLDQDQNVLQLSATDV